MVRVPESKWHTPPENIQNTVTGGHLVPHMHVSQFRKENSNNQFLVFKLKYSVPFLIFFVRILFSILINLLDHTITKIENREPVITPGLCSAFPSSPFEFVRLSLSSLVIRTLPHKHRVYECFSLGLPFLKRLYSHVCHVLLCVFSLTNIGFVQCLSPSPLLSLYAHLCNVMLCVLHLTNISFVQCFSLDFF